MEERRLRCDVRQRRSPKLVSVYGIAGNFLEPEILILTRTVEHHVSLSKPMTTALGSLAHRQTKQLYARWGQDQKRMAV